MMDKQKNREFLLKYCNIMVSTLDNVEDQERMNQWLEAVTSGKCEEEKSDMYLELILWALHTDRVNVFPFKYSPPVDPGEINDAKAELERVLSYLNAGYKAYKYALEIVQFEPDENVSEKCGEVKAIVTDDLKEYLAVQRVPGFGTHCFYAFSDNAPLSRWNMPPDMNIIKNDLSNEQKYWMTLFSRPERTIKETCKPVDEVGEEVEDKEGDNGNEVEESEKSICPDLCKVEYILNNLSFGGKRPQNIKSLLDENDPECNKRKSSVAESIDESSRKSSRKGSGEIDRKMSGESSRKSGESSRKLSGENDRKISRESRHMSGESNRKLSGESNRKISGATGRNISGEGNRKSSIKNTEVEIDSFLLSLDYPNNKFTDSPSSVKQEKKRKSDPSKTYKRTRPHSSSYPKWQTYSPDICSLDSNDQFTCKEDKSPSWVGYDMNMSSYPDDSTMALCGNSLNEEKDNVLMNMIHQHKYRQNMATSSASNRPSHQTNYLPRSSNSYRNQSTGSNGQMPQSNGKQNYRFPRERRDYEDTYPLTRRLREDQTTYIPSAPRSINDQRTPNYTRNYDRRSSTLDQNNISRSLPSRGERYRESTSQIKKVSQEVPRGCSDNEPTTVTSRTSLTNSIRSQRRLHFSEVHVEPKQHRPNISADNPLKPCLRKSSDESHPSDMPDYNRSQRTREFKRNEDQFVYPRSSSMRGSSPNNHRSGNI